MPDAPSTAYNIVGPSQSPSPGGPHLNSLAYTMRIGFLGGTEVQRVPPTFVLMPVYPSTQAIAVGQPVLATSALVAPMSRRSLVKGGPPTGNSPSSITSLFTLEATNA